MDAREEMEATRGGRKKEADATNDGEQERKGPGKGSTKTSSFLPSLFAHLWLSQLSQEGGGKGETECAVQPHSVKIPQTTSPEEARAK